MEEVLKAKEQVTSTTRELGNLLSPEGIIIMTIAVLLDLAGLICLILSFLGVGVPASWILDLVGFLIIGCWIFFRSGTISTTKKAAGLLQKSLKKFGLAFLGELIPFFGDFAFCWTLVVYLELTR